jgi:hypothetical protein
MSNVVLMLGAVIAGVLLLALALWRRGSGSAELGSVSHQWIAELRAGEPYDSTR